MKYKITEGTPFILAGVAKYGNQGSSSHQKENQHGSKNSKITFDFDLPSFTFDIDKEALKREALKAKEEAIKLKEAALRATDEFVNTYKQHYDEQNKTTPDSRSSNASSPDDSANEVHSEKEETSEKEVDSTSEEASQTDSDGYTQTSNEDSTDTQEKAKREDDEFTRYFNEFGKQMNAFGSAMGEYGKNIGKSMESWSKNFDKVFTKEWAEQMESSIKDIFNVEPKTPHHRPHPFGHEFVKEFNRHWTGSYSTEDYSLWQLESLFNELYSNNAELQQADLSPEAFYEVQCNDLGTTMHDDLLLVGCQVKSAKGLPYSVVVQRLVPEQWLIVKLTQEEYNKDWMKQVEKLEILKDYSLDSYFILRHFKSKEKQQASSYKIYIPLKEVR